jgi:hypothetical protein
LSPLPSCISKTQQGYKGKMMEMKSEEGRGEERRGEEKGRMEQME